MKKYTLSLLCAAALICASAQEYSVGTSTALWKNPSLIDFIDARDAGCKYLEVALNQCYRNVPQEEVILRAHALLNEISKSGMHVWSVHLPFSRTLDISVMDDTQREENVQIMASMIELSAIFQPQRLVLHPSSEPIADSEREQRIRNTIASINVLRKCAEKIGVLLCIENLPRTCLGNTPEELFRIVDSFPDVGICFDTNHYSDGDPVDFVKKAGTRIKTIHASDYDGINECHWLPGNGIIRWGELYYYLKKNGYDGVFMYETKSSDINGNISPGEIVESYKLIEESYGKYKQEIIEHNGI